MSDVLLLLTSANMLWFALCVSCQGLSFALSLKFCFYYHILLMPNADRRGTVPPYPLCRVAPMAGRPLWHPQVLSLAEGIQGEKSMDLQFMWTSKVCGINT